MQTYLVSPLLRTIASRVGMVFCLCIVQYSGWAGDWVPAVHYNRDSLLSHWSKNKSTLPTLMYEVADFRDFSDRVEAESLIRTYGIGGVILKNGSFEALKKWMAENNTRRPEPLLHVAAVDSLFRLPFEGLPAFPETWSVWCVSDDSLVYELGRVHGMFLREMGFGLIRFSYLPDYFSRTESRKAVSYLDGLTAAGIQFYFGSDCEDFQQNYEIFRPDRTERIIPLDWVWKDGVPDKKNLKKYRKWIGPQGLISTVYQNPEQTPEALENIIVGVGMVTLTKASNPHTLINAIFASGMLKKDNYRKYVKSYFGLVQAVNTRPTQTDRAAESWQALKKAWRYQDIVLMQDRETIVPIRNLEKAKILTLSENAIFFQQKVDRYKQALHLPLSVLKYPADSLMQIFESPTLLLVDLSTVDRKEDFEYWLSRCDSMQSSVPVIIWAAGEASWLNKDFSSTLFWSPRGRTDRGIMVEMAFGALPVRGALPGFLFENQMPRGEMRQDIGRLRYEDPLEGIDYRKLDLIDSIARLAIIETMTPGCQIMMIKNGHVLYNKNFGHHTYDSLTPVAWNHVYDIASVTKTVATVPAVMHQMERGELSLEGQLSDYLRQFSATDKSTLTLHKILTHQSGLKSYIPFWRYAQFMSDSNTFLYKRKLRRKQYAYHAINWNDSIQSWIAQSAYNSLSNEDGSYRYLYSDLGFMIMKEVVEQKCHCSLDQTLDEFLCKPLGMDYTGYNPLQKLPTSQIAPTEQDRSFRTTLLQGEVHDKNAALLGGVSGHAGLFANANDLAKYMQMMIAGGTYGGHRYFSDSTIQTFTGKKLPTDRRALGWDKPNPSTGNVSKYASESSFGHSGFTGTLIWADPEYDFIYIFLSNRIYPDPQNYKLIEGNIRTKIHDLMYESFLETGASRYPGS